MTELTVISCTVQWLCMVCGCIIQRESVWWKLFNTWQVLLRSYAVKAVRIVCVKDLWGKCIAFLNLGGTTKLSSHFGGGAFLFGSQKYNEPFQAAEWSIYNAVDRLKWTSWKISFFLWKQESHKNGKLFTYSAGR